MTLVIFKTKFPRTIKMTWRGSFYKYVNSVNSVKKDRENFLNISERNKKMSVISEKNKVNIKCSKYKKIEIRDNNSLISILW